MEGSGPILHDATQPQRQSGPEVKHHLLRGNKDEVKHRLWRQAIGHQASGLCCLRRLRQAVTGRQTDGYPTYLLERQIVVSGLMRRRPRLVRKGEIEELRFFEWYALGKFNCQARRQVVRAIRPGGEWGRHSLSAAGTKGNAERAPPGGACRPTLPKPGATSLLTPRLVGIGHPEQLEIRIAEEEASVGSPLPGMRVRRAFAKAETNQGIALRSARRAADEYMIDFKRHKRIPCCQVRQAWEKVNPGRRTRHWLGLQNTWCQRSACRKNVSLPRPWLPLSGL